MSGKLKIEYSKDMQIDKKTEMALQKIILQNDSKWVIALEAFCFCKKQIKKQ